MASGPVMVAHRGRTGFEGLTGHLDGLPDRSVTLSSMSLPFLASVPVVHFTSDLVLLIPVTLLDLAFELVAAAVDHVQVVIGELAPLLFDVALELLPVPFNPIPIHHRLLNSFAAYAAPGVPTESQRDGAYGLRLLSKARQHRKPTAISDVIESARLSMGTSCSTVFVTDAV